jgi:hypothetical protein
VQHAFIYNCNPVAGTNVFLNVRGDKTKEITLKGNNFKFTKQAMTKDNMVPGMIEVE